MIVFLQFTFSILVGRYVFVVCLLICCFFYICLIFFFFFFLCFAVFFFFFFFSSRRRHTRWTGDWSSDVCSSDLADWPELVAEALAAEARGLITVTGLWSHFACADEPGHPSIQAQLARFREMRSEERRVGKSVDLGGRRIIKKKSKRKKYKKEEVN